MLEKIKYKIRYARVKKRLKKLCEKANKQIIEGLKRIKRKEKQIELKEYICDQLCKYPCTCRSEEHLMEVCEECQVEEMLDEILGGAEHG